MQEQQLPGEVLVVDSARARAGQEGRDGEERGDAGGGAPGGEAAAGRGGLVPEADIGVAGEAGCPDIAREDIPDDTGGRERGAAGPLPPRDEVQAPQEEVASDGGDQHTGQDEHPREARGGGRPEVRGLGDGPHRREGSEERDTDPVREEQELPADGEAAVREGPREGRGGRRQAPVALQEERADHNHGQRLRVPVPQEDIGGPEGPRVFRRQLRLLAEGRDREHEQADKAVHPEGDGLPRALGRVHPLGPAEAQPQAKGEAALLNPQGRVLQTFVVILSRVALVP